MTGAKPPPPPRVPSCRVQVQLSFTQTDKTMHAIP